MRTRSRRFLFHLQLAMGHNQWNTIQRLITYGKMKAAEIETPMGKGYKKRYRIHRDWIKEFMFSKITKAAPQPQNPLRPNRKFRPKVDFIK